MTGHRLVMAGLEPRSPPSKVALVSSGLQLELLEQLRVER